jgi:hypothetical protein
MQEYPPTHAATIGVSIFLWLPAACATDLTSLEHELLCGEALTCYGDDLNAFSTSYQGHGSLDQRFNLL